MTNIMITDLQKRIGTLQDDISVFLKDLISNAELKTHTAAAKPLKNLCLVCSELKQKKKRLKQLSERYWELIINKNITFPVQEKAYSLQMDFVEKRIFDIQKRSNELEVLTRKIQDTLHSMLLLKQQFPEASYNDNRLQNSAQQFSQIINSVKCHMKNNSYPAVELLDSLRVFEKQLFDLNNMRSIVCTVDF